MNTVGTKVNAPTSNLTEPNYKTWNFTVHALSSVFNEIQFQSYLRVFYADIFYLHDKSISSRKCLFGARSIDFFIYIYISHYIQKKVLVLV